MRASRTTSNTTNPNYPFNHLRAFSSCQHPKSIFKCLPSFGWQGWRAAVSVGHRMFNKYRTTFPWLFLGFELIKRQKRARHERVAQAYCIAFILVFFLLSLSFCIEIVCFLFPKHWQQRQQKRGKILWWFLNRVLIFICRQRCCLWLCSCRRCRPQCYRCVFGRYIATYSYTYIQTYSIILKTCQHEFLPGFTVGARVRRLPQTKPDIHCERRHKMYMGNCGTSESKLQLMSRMRWGFRYERT